jgi:hypothetical protein
VDGGHVWNPGDHARSACVEHDHLAVTQMGDKQQLAIRFNAGVVESGRPSAQRNVGDLFQRKSVHFNTVVCA